ncbi:MAG: hypothetical protein NE328_03275 [Lentisphaeraceae bacterium]|nr:hypothetical protein [Lentisphaeraceae bacterium]
MKIIKPHIQVLLGAPHSGAASLSSRIIERRKIEFHAKAPRRQVLGAPHSGAALQKSLKEWKALPHAETQRRRGIEYKSGNTFHLINLILPFVYYLLPPSSFILFKPLTESQSHGIFFREHRHPAGNINSQITQVIIDRIYMLYRNLFPSAPLRLCERPFPNEFSSNKYWGKE